MEWDDTYIIERPLEEEESDGGVFGKVSATQVRRWKGIKLRLAPYRGDWAL